MHFNLRLTAFTEEFTSVTGELKRVVKWLWSSSSVRDTEALIPHKGKIRRQLLEGDTGEQGHYRGRNVRKGTFCVKYN